MKISNLIFILIISLTQIACSSSNISTAKNTVWSVELKKGGCLDVCQSYSILIKNDGQYEYMGYFKVKHKGKKSGALSQTEINQLSKLIQSIDWVNMEDTYGRSANDSQRNDLNYTSPTINKKIIYYRLEPQQLRDVEQLINTIIDHDEF